MGERISLSAALQFRSGTNAHYETPYLSELFYEAFRYAGLLHRSDIRITGVPYLSHLISVAGLVLENGGSEDETIAALLHDSLEDHSDICSVDSLDARFGSNIAKIIVECSDYVERPDEYPRREWEDRKRALISRLPSVSLSALKVMVADKVHNVRAMLLEAGVGRLVFWEELGRPAEQVTAYFQVCHRILRERLSTALVVELGKLTSELEAEHCRNSGLLVDWQRRLSGARYLG